MVAIIGQGQPLDPDLGGEAVGRCVRTVVDDREMAAGNLKNVPRGKVAPQLNRSVVAAADDARAVAGYGDADDLALIPAQDRVREGRGQCRVDGAERDR